jgi:transketolase
VLIGAGRMDFDYIHRLRRLGGLPGHPHTGTPWMVTNTGPLGMGISKAKGMVQANRLQGQQGRIFVLTGDGELQEGQIWESLPTAVRDRMGEITVIVDRNQIQSDTWVNDVSDLGDLEAKFSAFGWHAATCDGHDMGELGAVLEQFAKITDRPKVLIADTLKGKGVSFMEPSAMDPADPMYRYHSGAPSPDAYDKGLAELLARANELLAGIGESGLRLESVEKPAVPAPSASAQRLMPVYAEALKEQGGRNPKLVALDADLVLDCGIIPFRKAFPERFFECGIAEQDMVSQAGAMALRGLLPVVHSFACFLSTRPNEQIYNNATEHSKIIYVAPLAGLLPAGPGHSHQSVRDITAVGGNPGLVMLQPSCEEEVRAAVDYCVNTARQSCYLRLVSIPVDVPFQLPAGYQLQEGRGVTLREGRDGVIVAYGPVMLSEAYRAAERLSAQQGVELAVVNLPWLNRVDGEWLREIGESYPWVFTIDDHYLAGGQGQLILARLAELGLATPPSVRRFGLSEVPLCGWNGEVLRAHRLDEESLAEEIAQSLSLEPAGVAAR